VVLFRAAVEEEQQEEVPAHMLGELDQVYDVPGPAVSTTPALVELGSLSLSS
jgi:hypothetical protein